MKFDDILIQLGEFGPYQRRIYILICLVGLPCAFHGLGQVFLAGESDHWCFVPELETEDCGKWPEITPEGCEDAKKDASIPLQTKSISPYTYDNCLRYNLTNVPFFPGVHTPQYTNDTLDCDGNWVYDTSQYERTIISEFNLVCTRSTVTSLAQSIYFVGVLIGSLVFGSLADGIGRYYSYFIASLLFFVSGMAVAFSPSAVAYLIFRFFVGMGNLGAFVIAFVLGTEFVGPSKRMIAGIGIQGFFSIGSMLLALLAYLIRDWFVLELVITVPVALIFLLMPIVTESPRWLISKARFDEAEEIIRNVAKVNDATLPDILLTEDEKEQIIATNKERPPTAIHLFRTSTLRWRTLNLMFNWCVISLVYYGLSLSTSDLGSDPYVAFFLSGLVEVPSFIWCVFAIEWIGRKPNLAALLILGGIACIATIFVPLGTARTAVAMVGKFAIAGCFAIVYIYTAELYPTVIRGAAMGVCSMAARVGGIIAPLMLAIGNYWEPLPLIIFGSSSVIAGLLVLLLPETKNQKLPETLEESEHFGKNTSPETPTDVMVSTISANDNPVYVHDDENELQGKITLNGKYTS